MRTSSARERWLLLTAFGAGVLCLGAAEREAAPEVDLPASACVLPIEVEGRVARAGLVCAAEGTVASVVAAGGGAVACSLLADDARRAVRPGDKVSLGEGEHGVCALRVASMDGERLLALGLPIDVNHADPVSLDALPGIGPGLAKRIVAERACRAFASVDELRRVRGIGKKTLAKLRAFVTVGDSLRGGAPGAVVR